MFCDYVGPYEYIRPARVRETTDHRIRINQAISISLHHARQGLMTIDAWSINSPCLLQIHTLVVTFVRCQVEEKEEDKTASHDQLTRTCDLIPVFHFFCDPSTTTSLCYEST